MGLYECEIMFEIVIPRNQLKFKDVFITTFAQCEEYINNNHVKNFIVPSKILKNKWLSIYLVYLYKP